MTTTTIRMIIIHCGGIPRAMPAGPAADALQAEDAKASSERGPALLDILGFPHAIPWKEAMQELARLGARAGDAMISLGSLAGSGGGLARITLIDKGPHDATRFATRLGAALGADKRSTLGGASAPAPAELAAIAEAWELDRSSATITCAPGSKPRI